LKVYERYLSIEYKAIYSILLMKHNRRIRKKALQYKGSPKRSGIFRRMLLGLWTPAVPR
jgi:hypothetical protein